MKVEMYCPNGHEPVVDEEKSNENWVVYKSLCPDCGERLLVRTVED